jgi:hypothetical protein
MDLLSVVPCISTENQLILMIQNYYPLENREKVYELYLKGSPFSLLRILCMVDVFATAFSYRTFECPNDEIWWHLDAVGKALERGSLDLVYCEKFLAPFSYKPGKFGNSGQPKLFFTLLTACLNAIKLGYDSIVEAGCGDGFGGHNHRAVANVLTHHYPDLKFTIKGFDPYAIIGQDVYGGVTIVRRSIAVNYEDTFDVPVVADIFDGHRWNDVQTSIKAPHVIKKQIIGSNMDGICQPYHTELRVVPGNKQLAFLCKKIVSHRFFDHCGDCRKWIALAIEYHLDLDFIASQLIILGYTPCGHDVSTKQFGAVIHNLKNREPKSVMTVSRESVGVKQSHWERKIKQLLEVNHITVEKSVFPLILPPSKFGSVFYHGVVPVVNSNFAYCDDIEIVNGYVARLPEFFHVVAEEVFSKKKCVVIEVDSIRVIVGDFIQTLVKEKQPLLIGRYGMKNYEFYKGNDICSINEFFNVLISNYPLSEMELCNHKEMLLSSVVAADEKQAHDILAEWDLDSILDDIVDSNSIPAHCRPTNEFAHYTPGDEKTTGVATVGDGRLVVPGLGVIDDVSKLKVLRSGLSRNVLTQYKIDKGYCIECYVQSLSYDRMNNWFWFADFVDMMCDNCHQIPVVAIYIQPVFVKLYAVGELQRWQPQLASNVNLINAVTRKLYCAKCSKKKTIAYCVVNHRCDGCGSACDDVWYSDSSG